MVASRLPLPGRFAPITVLAVTLAVFALVVGYVSFRLRSGLRDQVLRREAETLTEIASLQLANEAEALAAVGLADAPGELLSAVLKTSKLRGVFAVRVFDADKHFNGALPLPWSEMPPAAEDWERLETGRPIARLHRRESAAEVIGLAPTVPDERAGEPLMETWLPLRRGDEEKLAGVAQMWTDGQAIAGEFASIDRRLWWQAGMAWAAGAAIISVVMMWAFRRLAQANQQLRSRTEDLERANRQLTFAAKSSALGAVAAHLMHELKNPVAGLEELVGSRGESVRGADGGELAAASELTRRLRRMINDVAAVMRDEQQGADFELTGGEIAELALDKARPLAAPHRVTLVAEAGPTGGVGGRRANLAMLVLKNLLQNAIEASPPGGEVRVAVRADNGSIHFAVEDRGSGLPPAIRERLFQPVASPKPGGSGLGLALSQQLARQAQGRVELVRSDMRGTCFQLVLDAAAET